MSTFERVSYLKFTSRINLYFRQLEDLACEIVNNFNSSGPEGAIQIREALHADFKSEFPALERIMTPYEEYLYRKFDKSKEIMTVAYKAKAMVKSISIILK